MQIVKKDKETKMKLGRQINCNKFPVINPFKKIGSARFTQFDIIYFYPSTLRSLLDTTIEFDKRHFDIKPVNFILFHVDEKKKTE